MVRAKREREDRLIVHSHEDQLRAVRGAIVSSRGCDQLGALKLYVLVLHNWLIVPIWLTHVQRFILN